jgi:hypothetical protein
MTQCAHGIRLRSGFAESEDPHEQYRGVMRVRNDLDHGGYLVLRGWAKVQDWAAAAAQVRNLVAATDGPDTAATESTPRSPRQSLKTDGRVGDVVGEPVRLGVADQMNEEESDALADVAGGAADGRRTRSPREPR